MKKGMAFIVSIIILISGCSVTEKNLATDTPDIKQKHSNFSKEFNTAHGFTVVLAENWKEAPKIFIDQFTSFSKTIARQMEYP